MLELGGAIDEVFEVAIQWSDVAESLITNPLLVNGSTDFTHHNRYWSPQLALTGAPDKAESPVAG